MTAHGRVETVELSAAELVGQTSAAPTSVPMSLLSIPAGRGRSNQGNVGMAALTISTQRPACTALPHRRAINGWHLSLGAFSEGQRRYLEFHRENVLRMARGVAAR